jgi:glycosyltransferase involved in cell wall biosynthesis
MTRTVEVPRLHLVLPGDPGTVSGGYIYDRRIVEGLRSLDWAVTVHALDASFPLPDATALAAARSVLSAIPDGDLVLMDGLALGGMPGLVADEASRLRLIALIHHPLAEETGLAPARAAALASAERRALAAMQRVVATSQTTADALASYGVCAERVAVVEPGTDPAPLAQGSGGPGLELLCVASLTPRKGHALLLEALVELVDRPWHLVCAGSAELSPETAADIRRRLQLPALAGRVTLLDVLDPTALARCYHRADLFVLPTYYEGYGMVLSEALARGLPILSTLAGAVPATVPADAGLLVPPGDRQALTAALRLLLDDPARLARLAQGARAARRSLPTWESAAMRMAAVLRELSS